MALLNTAWLGDLSTSLHLFVSHTNTSSYSFLPSLSLCQAPVLPPSRPAHARSHRLSVPLRSLLHSHHTRFSICWSSNAFLERWEGEMERWRGRQKVCVSPPSPFSQQRPQLLPVRWIKDDRVIISGDYQLTMILSNLKSDVSCITNMSHVNCDTIMFAVKPKQFHPHRETLWISLSPPFVFSLQHNHLSLSFYLPLSPHTHISFLPLSLIHSYTQPQRAHTHTQST